MSEKMEVEMADKFDGWNRGESIGEGGQARTYKAYKDGDEKRRTYVIKLLKHKSNSKRLKRFEQEINVGLRLAHPNVIKVEGYNIEHYEPYIVTEYCPGNDLAKAEISKLSMM